LAQKYIHTLTYVSQNSRLGKSVSIGPFSVVGLPTRSSILKANRGKKNIDVLPTLIGDRTIIGSNVTIEEGVRIGKDVVIESGAVIEKGSIIGAGSFVVHGARILADVNIGNKCVIGGLIADRTIIGDHSRVFGNLIHRQDNPTSSWDGMTEESPRIDEHVFISFGAQVIGNVRIGHHTYVCANAVVTMDVQPYQIVVGINRSIQHTKWKGRLRHSKFWKEQI
jgi:acetyltransferase-like isoleucine patch superfamily enzyme